MRRRAVASFEEPVKQISRQVRPHRPVLDAACCWWSTRAAGEDLGKAESQAFAYIQDLIREGRQDEVPRYVIVSDFARIALHDLEPEDAAAAAAVRRLSG